MSTWKCFNCDIKEPCVLTDDVSTADPVSCPFECEQARWVRTDGQPFTVIGTFASTDELFAEHVIAESAAEARDKMNIVL